MRAGREEFLAWLAADFPDLIAGFGPYSAVLLHCEIGDFRQATERAMDAGRLGEAERHFRLVVAASRRTKRTPLIAPGGDAK